MNIAQRIKDYYESDDFKSNYLYCIYENFNEFDIIPRIEQVLNSYECEVKYGASLVLTKLQLKQVFDYIYENFEEFEDTFNGYYTGGNDIDSMSYGEQEEQLEGLFNHKTNKPYTMKYLKHIFDEEGFYISDNGCAYYDMSGEGVYINLFKSEIPLLKELGRKQALFNDTELIKTYKAFRSAKLGGIVGENAKSCLWSARVLLNFRKLENYELVRLDKTHEEENYFDVYGEEENESFKKAIINSIERFGCFRVYSEVKCKACESWELVDSIGMCIYESPLNPFENDYVIDLMHSAIKSLMKTDIHLKDCFKALNFAKLYKMS